MKEIKQNLVVQRKAGGSIVERCPVFSFDAESLYLVWGSVVRAYSVKTGELVSEYEGLNGKVIGVQLHPTNPNAIVACSRKGNLIQWDWRSRLPGTVVKLKNNKWWKGVTEFRMLPPNPEDSNSGCRVFVVWKDKDLDVKRVSVCCAETGTHLGDLQFILANHSHCISFGGQFVAGIYRNGVQFCDILDWKNCDQQHIRNSRSFTSVACHPEKRCIATGDSFGRILLWFNLLSSGKPTYSVYHWHTLPCETITFSHAGVHFFSGGGEGVLVKWTMDSPEDKDFLPRLPAGICHLAVAPENKYLAISTIDNGIRIVSPQMDLCSVIQHFTWSVEVRHGLSYFPAGIKFDPHTKALVLNGRTGHIQFYSPRTMSLLYNLDIVEMNYLTQERNTLIVNTDVTRVALNNDGRWMATVEFRDDGETNVEVRLKFWHFDDTKQIFCLNTSVELPHNGSVTAVAFQPTQDPQHQLAVTSGSDLKFRTWSLVESSNIYKQGRLVWRCECVGFYRSLSAGDLSFSMDGSLLAVAFGPTLTVWVPETNQLKCSLTPAKVEADISHVEFGQADCCHLVVTCTKQNVNVWNLLTLKLMWTVPLQVSILAADPCSEFMAVFTTKNNLFVFSPRNSKPVYDHEMDSRSNSKIVCASFIPHGGLENSHNIPWQENSKLYFLDSNQELLVLEPPGKYLNEKEGLILPLSTLQTVTPFGSLLAKKKISEVEKLQVDTEQQLGVPGATAIRELLSAPPHTMPPVNLLCGPFLRSIVSSSSKNGKEIGLSRGADDEEDEESDTERMETEDSGLDSGDETSGPEIVKKSNSDELSRRKTPSSANTTNLQDLEVQLSNVLNEKVDWVKKLVAQ